MPPIAPLYEALLKRLNLGMGFEEFVTNMGLLGREERGKFAASLTGGKAPEKAEIFRLLTRAYNDAEEIAGLGGAPVSSRTREPGKSFFRRGAEPVQLQGQPFEVQGGYQGSVISPAKTLIEGEPASSPINPLDLESSLRSLTQISTSTNTFKVLASERARLMPLVPEPQQQPFHSRTPDPGLRRFIPGTQRQAFEAAERGRHVETTEAVRPSAHPPKQAEAIAATGRLQRMTDAFTHLFTYGKVEITPEIEKHLGETFTPAIISPEQALPAVSRKGDDIFLGVVNKISDALQRVVDSEPGSMDEIDELVFTELKKIGLGSDYTQKGFIREYLTKRGRIDQLRLDLNEVFRKKSGEAKKRINLNGYIEAWALAAHDALTDELPAGTLKRRLKQIIETRMIERGPALPPDADPELAKKVGDFLGVFADVESARGTIREPKQYPGKTTPIGAGRGIVARSEQKITRTLRNDPTLAKSLGSNILLPGRAGHIFQPIEDPRAPMPIGHIVRIKEGRTLTFRLGGGTTPFKGEDITFSTGALAGKDLVILATGAEHASPFAVSAEQIGPKPRPAALVAPRIGGVLRRDMATSVELKDLSPHLPATNDSKQQARAAMQNIRENAASNEDFRTLVKLQGIDIAMATGAEKPTSYVVTIPRGKGELPQVISVHDRSTFKDLILTNDRADFTAVTGDSGYEAAVRSEALAREKIGHEVVKQIAGPLQAGEREVAFNRLGNLMGALSGKDLESVTGMKLSATDITGLKNKWLEDTQSMLSLGADPFWTLRSDPVFQKIAMRIQSASRADFPSSEESFAIADKLLRTMEVAEFSYVGPARDPKAPFDAIAKRFGSELLREVRRRNIDPESIKILDAVEIEKALPRLKETAGVATGGVSEEIPRGFEVAQEEKLGLGRKRASKSLRRVANEIDLAVQARKQFEATGVPGKAETGYKVITYPDKVREEVDQILAEMSRISSKMPTLPSRFLSKAAEKEGIPALIPVEEDLQRITRLRQRLAEIEKKHPPHAEFVPYHPTELSYVVVNGEKLVPRAGPLGVRMERIPVNLIWDLSKVPDMLDQEKAKEAFFKLELTLQLKKAKGLGPKPGTEPSRL